MESYTFEILNVGWTYSQRLFVYIQVRWNPLPYDFDETKKKRELGKDDGKEGCGW
jgi:hypothetical protein